jgi:ribosomal protein S18 acetylase RimI-like enzyme
VAEQAIAIVRRAAAPDAAALALVGGATFLETFAGIIDGRDILDHCAKKHSVAVYEAFLSAPAAALWLAETVEGSAPVGYAVLDTPQLPLADVQTDDLELKRIYVLSRFHGTGVGAQLMTDALEEAKRRNSRRVLLGVYAQNHRALGFYAKHGFVRVGQRQFQVGAHTYFDHILARALP